MSVSDCISVNERGHLTIGSYDTVELVKQFGSPLYAYDENEIRKNLREFKSPLMMNTAETVLWFMLQRPFAAKRWLA